MNINKTSGLRIIVKMVELQSGEGDQCFCQPSCSFIPHLVLKEVQSGGSGIIEGESEDSLVQPVVYHKGDVQNSVSGRDKHQGVAKVAKVTK